ncbi:hypothetical protein ONZ45_g13183 [Pleurotus djamor]|nr:hypothetical protein ONZ45_g13183 [Pleurotus djamor]
MSAQQGKSLNIKWVSSDRGTMLNGSWLGTDVYGERHEYWRNAIIAMRRRGPKPYLPEEDTSGDADNEREVYGSCNGGHIATSKNSHVTYISRDADQSDNDSSEPPVGGDTFSFGGGLKLVHPSATEGGIQGAEDLIHFHKCVHAAASAKRLFEPCEAQSTKNALGQFSGEDIQENGLLIAPQETVYSGEKAERKMIPLPRRALSRISNTVHRIEAASTSAPASPKKPEVLDTLSNEVCAQHTTNIPGVFKLVDPFLQESEDSSTSDSEESDDATDADVDKTFQVLERFTWLSAPTHLGPNRSSIQ